MLSVIYADWHFAECHYAEWRYAVWHYSECHKLDYYTGCLNNECYCHYAYCHKLDRYAVCHYDKCCYAESHGALSTRPLEIWCW